MQLVQEEFLGVYRKKPEYDIVWLFRLFENKIDLALILHIPLESYDHG